VTAASVVGGMGALSPFLFANAADGVRVVSRFFLGALHLEKTTSA